MLMKNVRLVDMHAMILYTTTDHYNKTCRVKSWLWKISRFRSAWGLEEVKKLCITHATSHTSMYLLAILTSLIN